MDGVSVFRLMSLIPDRVARSQSGSLFDAGGRTERIELLTKFLNWLGPLEPISKETQQLLGVRSGGGRPLDAEGEPGEDELDVSPIAEEAPAAPQEPRENAWA